MYRYASMINGKFQTVNDPQSADFYLPIDLLYPHRRIHISNVQSIDAIPFVVLDPERFYNLFIDKVFTNYCFGEAYSWTLKRNVHHVIIYVKHGYTDRFTVKDLYEQLKQYYKGIFYDNYPVINSYINLPSKMNNIKTNNNVQTLPQIIERLKIISEGKIVPQYCAEIDANYLHKRFSEELISIKGYEVLGSECLSYASLFIALLQQYNLTAKEVDKILTNKELNYIKSVYLNKVTPLWALLIEYKLAEYGKKPPIFKLNKYEFKIYNNTWKMILGTEQYAISLFDKFKNLYTLQHFLQCGCNVELPLIFYSKYKQIQLALSNMYIPIEVRDYWESRYGRYIHRSDSTVNCSSN